MSPDDIFAAQFWPWPDPAIKRDNQGRVLFLNAAFLQLYGGTVQDWTGNVVGGWPTPQGPGQPYRFETRMPMTHDASEQVYDWIEMTLADGHAFALARNVSLFMQPADPQPGAEIPAQMLPDYAAMAAQNAAMQADAANTYIPEMAAAPVYDGQDMSAQMNTAPPQLQQAMPDMQNVTQAAAPLQDTFQPSNFEPNTFEPNNFPLDTVQETQSHEPVVFAEYTPEPEVLAQAAVAPAAPVPEVAPAAPQAQAPGEAPVTQTVEASDIPNVPERAYDRRALPIENESAVLGNNWRDAVIAKAVGADMAPAAAEPEPAAVSAVDEGESIKRILLAEDNAINALLTRTLLEAEGHIVETVQDGQLAVEAMKTSTYDLIFMDMRMPNMDGLEATRKIRTLPNVRKDLPIIALTANAFDDDRNACFDSGMNDFMTKPVSAEELSEMVTQWTMPKEERMAS